MKNKLIILGGFAGAGKTTIAKKLAADFNYPFFNPDDFNAGLTPLLKKSFHEISPIAYDLLWHILKKNLKMGVTCVLDANMCNPFTWKTVDEIKKNFKNIEVVPMILMCPLNVHKTRVEKRGVEDKEHFNLGGDKWESIVHKYDFMNSLKRDDIIRINAGKSIEDVYSDILNILK